MNKANGGGRISGKLFKILKDDAAKALHSLCQLLENSAMATGLEKISFHSKSKKGHCQRIFKIPYT